MEAAVIQAPENCPYAVDEGERRACIKHGHPVYVECERPAFGEPPKCSWEEPDNSPEACTRRLDWLKGLA